jgi:hypothetical protein
VVGWFVVCAGAPACSTLDCEERSERRSVRFALSSVAISGGGFTVTGGPLSGRYASCTELCRALRGAVEVDGCTTPTRVDEPLNPRPEPGDLTQHWRMECSIVAVSCSGPPAAPAPLGPR